MGDTDSITRRITRRLNLWIWPDNGRLSTIEYAFAQNQFCLASLDLGIAPDPRGLSTVPAIVEAVTQLWSL